ncbi:MAG: hypothetical protein M1823_004125 [Watsoniomyces obsoletus]|nr:MAG: hypothetical protein M1823_004125 [Watsoniomyces obsoletus]
MRGRGPGRPPRIRPNHSNTDELNDENAQQVEDAQKTAHRRPDGPPWKRRKLEEAAAGRSASSSSAAAAVRPPSPPWKPVAVQGPSSFVEDGRRKSSRTNIVPLELQPPTEKRQTRSHLQQKSVVTTKSIYGGASLRAAQSPPNAQSTTGSQYRRRNTMPSTRPVSQNATSPTLEAEGEASTPRRFPLRRKSVVSPAVKSTPRRRPTAMKEEDDDEDEDEDDEEEEDEEDDNDDDDDDDDETQETSIISPTHGMQTRRPHERRVSIRRVDPPVRRGRGRPPTRRVEDEGGGQDGIDAAREDRNQVDGDGVDHDDTDGEDRDHNTGDKHTTITKTPRLKFHVKMPEVPIAHPGHLPPDRRFASFREWLQSDDPLSGEDVRGRTTEEAEREAHLRTRIVEAAEPGGLLSEERCTLFSPAAQDEPPRQYAHQDHLVSQALYLRKLMERERATHQAHAKRLAHAAVAEWRRRQPKTEEELQQEQLEARRSRHRQVQRDLRAKWDVVTGEVQRRRQARWEEEQEARGKQALNEILAHSSLLLDARRAAGPTSGASSEVEDDDDDGISGDDDESNDDDDDDESNMSQSQSTSDELVSGAEDEEDDEHLTVEELRIKYALKEASSLPSAEPPSEQDHHAMLPNGHHDPADDHSEVHEEEEKNRDGDAMSIDAPSNVVDPVDAPQPEPDDHDDTLLNESDDESVDMDDDLGDSDEGQDSDESKDDDEEEEEEQDEESEDGEQAGPGLLGLFSRKELVVDQTPNGVQQDNMTNGEEIKEEPMDVDMPAVQQQPKAVVNGNHHLASVPSIENSTVKSSKLPPPPILTSTERTLDVVYQSSGDPSSQASPGTNATTKPSELDSASSMGLHADSRVPSSLTTPQPTYELKTPIPSLLRGTLREYQHYGLDWLAGLYANGTNGILADEMGLGKTIQTIALLAHLACHHHVWGPHLIVVPTSVMLNWEMEFKKWCPGFKIMTYYGTQEERKQKRLGWTNDNKWNVCISSYQLVLQDHKTFKRRNWHYMVLDEAHHIKNFRSKRWQALLTFKTRARLLLTGTPLQNNLTELWSLLFFLMPAESAEGGIGGFADLKDFSEWFKRPVEQILEHGRDTMDDEAKMIVSKLHKVLRPYLLRRLKADVEKQMPDKHEHVICCRLSKRQRYLYDGFMSRAQTREKLRSGNYLSIMNCLMQLRKVCNHPDLFETRPIVTSFALPKSATADFEIKELLVRRRLLQEEPTTRVNLDVIGGLKLALESMSAISAKEISRLTAEPKLQLAVRTMEPRLNSEMAYDPTSIDSVLTHLKNAVRATLHGELNHSIYVNRHRSQLSPVYGRGLVERLTINTGLTGRFQRPPRPAQWSEWSFNSSKFLREIVLDLPQRAATMEPAVRKFACVTPTVVAPDLVPMTLRKEGMRTVREAQSMCSEDVFHEARMRLSIAFPDKRLLQYDCGKLQRLDQLLRELLAGGHRALIFTQMTKVLDILEQFLNIHGHRYLRLDGATKVEERLVLTERFNNDPRIPVFILSTRSGGLGINLTGADTVIFYDIDWNPAMDKQCQDRCHRIGQTRDVHIYRFVCEYTIESNILRKANQKKMLDDVVIQEGEFTTDYFNKMSVRDMLGDDAGVLDGEDALANAAMDRVLNVNGGTGGNSKVLEEVEDAEDILAAKAAEKEIVQDEVDFDEKVSVSAGGGGGVGGVETPVVIETPRSGAFPSTNKTTVLRNGSISIGGNDNSNGNVISKEVTMYDAPSPTSTPTPFLQDTPTIQRPISTNDQQPFIHEEPVVNANKDDHPEDHEEEEEKEPGHIDEYMLRFVEWELRDVPVGSGVVIDRGGTGLTAREKKNKKKKGGMSKSGGGGGGGRSGGPRTKKRRIDDGNAMTRTSSEGGVGITGRNGSRGRGRGRGRGNGNGKGRSISRRR